MGPLGVCRLLGWFSVLNFKFFICGTEAPFTVELCWCHAPTKIETYYSCLEAYKTNFTHAFSIKGSREHSCCRCFSHLGNCQSWPVECHPQVLLWTHSSFHANSTAVRMFSCTIKRRSTQSIIALSPWRPYLSISTGCLSLVYQFSHGQKSMRETFLRFFLRVGTSAIRCTPGHYAGTSSPQMHKHGNMSTTLPLQSDPQGWC